MPQPLPPGRAVRVRVPATSANLGPGFDAFGLALDLHDEVTVTTTTGEVAVDVAGEGEATVSRGVDNLVVRSLLSALDVFGVRAEGVQVSCSNAIPHGRGLGSSAAAIVAGLAAAHALAGAPADAPLLALATALEGHPDNVAAALLGGFTIAWVDDAGPQAVRLDPSPEVSAVAYVAVAPVSTELARGLLPQDVPHRDAARNAGRAALLVEALTRRPDLLHAATEDRLHQAYRGAAMPGSLALVERLRADGVAAVVSGAGPTVLAFCDASVAARMAQVSVDGFLPPRVLPLARSGVRTVALG